MGKGCKRRPCLVDVDTFADNWEKAFSKGKKDKKIKKDEKNIKNGEK